MIEFPWRTYKSIVGTIYRPLAVVELRGPRASLDSYMLIDSGADISIIPLATGEYLGFRRINGEPELDIYRGGRQVPCLIRQVGMTIGEFSFTAPVAWSQVFDAPRILGRYGVFQHFYIEFREYELKTIFRRPEES
jgi:hypothetical protein